MGDANEKVGPPAAGVMVSAVGSDLAIYEPGAAVGLILNGTARAVWSLCDGTRSADDIVRALAQEFDVDPASIAQDVHRVVAELREAGVLAGGPAHVEEADG